MLIQAFERRVLTYMPGNPPAFQVEMGNVGAHYRDWRYGGPGNMGGSPCGPHLGYGFRLAVLPGRGPRAAAPRTPGSTVCASRSSGPIQQSTRQILWGS